MKVFISHSSTDEKLAQRIAHVLRDAGFQVWDATQILPGDNWGIQLAKALQESEAMVVLLTPNSVHAPNLSYEVGYALGEVGYKGRVIPVFAASLAQLPKEDIPWVLYKFPMIHLQDQEQDEEGLQSIVQTLLAAA
ncbi:MAG: toll/interleukin-1 receptor domain-containing protein [Candidatus Tectomicrobia bacterium]|uniref:Toll/interleukin-1 receptor domain-containing protein n=1 Tax=Tectimicrobiota bacterium TaxID=2528274 RepID=A0A937W0A3_UNCTE|nr:toll/interleukin-1 receptor domain-containing protein [Candidatus Tectomicrobia bacterium]